MPDECSGRRLRVAYLWRIGFSFPITHYALPIEHTQKTQSHYYYTYIIASVKLSTIFEMKNSQWKNFIDYSNKNILISSQDEYKIQLNTNQMISFSTLTKNLTIPLILLSTCQHLLKNGFQTILPMKKYLKKQLFIMKIHLIKQGT